MASRTFRADPPHAPGSAGGPVPVSGLAPALLNLPSLDPSDLSPVNISLARAAYTATLMEELQVFAAFERLLELLVEGKLSTSSTTTASTSRVERDDPPHRMSFHERRDLYARVLGSAGARPRSRPNTDFYRLLFAFVGEVDRQFQKRPGRAARQTADPAETRRLCRAARELGHNLSLHAAGIQLQVSQLTKQLQEALALLSDPHILGAYGASNAWEVVARVAAEEFGKAPDVASLRSLAESGSRVLDWLSQGTARIQACDRQPLLDSRLFRAASRTPRSGSVSDGGLVEACHEWLAASAALGMPLR